MKLVNDFLLAVDIVPLLQYQLWHELSRLMSHKPLLLVDNAHEVSINNDVGIVSNKGSIFKSC